MDNRYHIFGLDIQSPLALPGLPVPETLLASAPDAVIAFGDTPSQLAHPLTQGVRFQASPGEFLLRVDSLARFYVKEGTSITITPEPGASEEEILVFLLGSSMSALLQQRNMLVLHACAIMTGNESVVFLGPSGVGKSTLAAGFHQRGHTLLTDDVCAVEEIHGKPQVIPGYYRLKLWADCLNKLKIDKDNLKSVRWDNGMEKYVLSVERHKHSPVPIKAIFVLQTGNTDDISVSAVRGAKKMTLLVNNSLRLGYVRGFGKKEDHLIRCAKLSAKANVYQAIRPQRGFQLDELMDHIEERFSS